jgi:hypothetical protein
MKIMSIALFARDDISVVFLVCISLLSESNKVVVAQITTARKWECNDGVKQLAGPSSAVWDPDADRMIFAPSGFGASGFSYLMSWDVVKPPDTGCVAIAFDGTHAGPPTESVDGPSAKTRGGLAILLLFDSSSNILGYVCGDRAGDRLLFVSKID